MRLAPVNFLVRFAVGAEPALDSGDEPEHGAPLPAAGVVAHGAVKADPGQPAVVFCYFGAGWFCRIGIHPIPPLFLPATSLATQRT